MHAEFDYVQKKHLLNISNNDRAAVQVHLTSSLHLVTVYATNEANN